MSTEPVSPAAEVRPAEPPRETVEQILARANAALAKLNEYRFQHLGSDHCPRCANLLQRKNKASRLWVCRDRIIPVPFRSGEYRYIKGCDYQRG